LSTAHCFTVCSDGSARKWGTPAPSAKRAAALRQPLYVVAEKILAPFERLRADWTIAGTTGYEFANLVNGLFVDPAAERPFDRIYARFTGSDADYDSIAYDAKRRIMAVNLASELTVLATDLSRIAATDRRSSDFTYNGLRDALSEVVAAFLDSLTQFVAGKSGDRIGAAGVLAGGLEVLADVLLVVADVRLLEQARLAVELLHLAGDHLLHDVLRFARFRGLVARDLALCVEILLRHVVAPDETRLRCSDVHCHVACNFALSIVRLDRYQLDHSAVLAVGLVLVA